MDVSHDTWVSDVGPEGDGNNGGASRLKLKSIQEMTLLDVDAAPLRGRTIRSAALHLRKAGDEPVRRVTVSGVGAEWFEGTGSGYAVQPGGVTFRHRRHPDLPWSIGGGDLCHAILANGGTTWRMADASPPDRDGWQVIPVDSKVIATRAAGLSYGFLVFDDTGSEWTRQGESFTFRLFPNRFAYSREQNRASAPYFEVVPGPEDRRPPSAPTGLRVEPQTALLPSGEALVSWVTPPDAGSAGTLGFFAELGGRAVPRELIPMAARQRPGRDAPPRREADTRLIGHTLHPRRGRGWQPRPRGDGGHPSLRSAPHAAARSVDNPGPIRAREETAPPGIDRGRRPRRAGQGPHRQRRADSLPAGGLSGRQSPLECGRRPDRTPGGAE